MSSDDTNASLFERRKVSNVIWFLRRDLGKRTAHNITHVSFHETESVRKINNKRETLKVRLSHEIYYVKIFRYPGLLSKVFAAVRSKGKYEFRLAGILNRSGITVPQCVAYGSCQRFGFVVKEYFITREVVGSQTINDFFLHRFKTFPRKKKKIIIRYLAGFIKKIHEQGILHSDLHAGNILIKEFDDHYSFYLLDLSEAKMKIALQASDRYSNLALLNLNFFMRVEKSLRYYFFKQYSGNMKSPGERRAAIRKIENLTLTRALDLLEKRKKRCVQNNKAFRVQKYGNMVICSKRERDLPQKLVESPDTYLTGHGNKNILKNGNTVRAAKVIVDDYPPLFLKRYNYQGVFHATKSLVRKTRARKVWIHGNAFQLRGIPVAEPIACMEQKKGLLVYTSYFLADFIPNCLTLHTVMMNESGTIEEKKQILLRLAEQVAHMHTFGCLHGDLKWSNIGIQNQSDMILLYFMDLDGSKVRKKLSDKEKTKDIARCYYDLTRYTSDSSLHDCFLDTYYAKSSLSVSRDDFLNNIQRINQHRMIKKLTLL